MITTMYYARATAHDAREQYNLILKIIFRAQQRHPFRNFVKCDSVK